MQIIGQLWALWLAMVVCGYGFAIYAQIRAAKGFFKGSKGLFESMSEDGDPTENVLNGVGGMANGIGKRVVGIAVGAAIGALGTLLFGVAVIINVTSDEPVQQGDSSAKPTPQLEQPSTVRIVE